MNIAAIIIGIDGWEKYTLPLVESIRGYEPLCEIVIVDNESKDRYPQYIEAGPPLGAGFCYTARTKRLCYSAAINFGAAWAPPPDWYIVLSNDVLCTGPFAAELAKQDGEAVIGPLLKSVHGFDYIEGWCVAIPRKIWERVGGWDENYIGSSWEDVGFSTSAREQGFWLEQVDLPFTHLDQKQRFYVVDDFWAKDTHNREYFLKKHAQVTA
jgi:GT2 family glycosyltransferase